MGHSRTRHSGQPGVIIHLYDRFEPCRRQQRVDGVLLIMAMFQCDETTRLYVMLGIRAECTNTVQTVLAGKKGCGRFKASRGRFQRRFNSPDIGWITHECIKLAAL